MADEVRRLAAPLTVPEGFVALYRREAELVLRFCARRVLDAETAVDLCAETFAQAFRGRRGFRGTTEVEARAWLLTIARRQVARYLKKGALDRRARDALGIQTPRLQEGEAEASAEPDAVHARRLRQREGRARVRETRLSCGAPDARGGKVTRAWTRGGGSRAST
jgi:DNA-directed RNA polymerase specialized sigma24 family protein